MHIDIQQLLFHRNENMIFPEISCFIEEGDIIQITGSNGAGKTTLLKTIAGIYQPTAGSIHPQFFSKLFIGHETGMNVQLSPLENLSFYQQFHGKSLKEKILAVLKELQLEKDIDTPFQQLSAGQKQRVALAQLTLIPAHVWLLDEPYSHLDHRSIDWLNQQILQHSAEKGVIIFTSHQNIEFPSQKYLSL